MNKLLIIFCILSLSLAAFLAGYFISQDGFTRQPANLGQNNILNKFDAEDNLATKSPALFPLSSGSVLSPALSKDKASIIYYAQKDGRTFEVSPKDGRERTISETPLANLIGTIWSPTKKEVISIFYADNKEQFRYYNFQTRKVSAFDLTTKSVAFSPDGSRIAYFQSVGLNGAIYVSAPDGSSSRKILDTRLTDLELYWPTNDGVAFRVSEKEGDSLYTLSLSGDLTKVLSQAVKLNILWSSDGTRLLFSKKEGDAIVLMIKELDTLKEQLLPVSASASKCTWGVDPATLYCAIQRSNAGGDDFYKIKLDGTKELINSPEKNMPAKNLILTGAEEFLVFVNNLDNRLYAIRLAK